MGRPDRATASLPCVPCTGALVIATNVLSLLNILNILNIVRSIWNIIFGVLMIFLQLNWRKMITRNFGFLNHWCAPLRPRPVSVPRFSLGGPTTWALSRRAPRATAPLNRVCCACRCVLVWGDRFMRSCFFIFVGTNSMHTDSGDAGSDFFSLVVGFTCIFVGVVEMCFGFKARDREDEEGSNGKSSKAKTGEVSGLQVNITPQQAAGAANWAAANPNVVAAAAGAAASAGGAAAASGKGGSDNPFFGNQHLNSN